MRSAALTLLGKRIRQLRKDHGWTQEQLAEAADLHENYVSRLETGEQEPGFFVLLKLCRAFGLAPGALLEEFTLAAVQRWKLR